MNGAAPFRGALNWIAAAWAIGAVSIGVVCMMAPQASPIEPLAAAAITIGSGLVATVAMLIGAMLNRSLCPPYHANDSVHAANPAAAMLASAVAGMLVRLVGTVALFMTCRYHLAASVEVVGSMTVGWYLYLTTVEVAALARELKRIDHVPAAKRPLAATQRPTLDTSP